MCGIALVVRVNRLEPVVVACIGVEPLSLGLQQNAAVYGFLHDLLAAQNAGAIAVLIETHPKADHYKAHADYSISHMSELPGIITKLEQE